MTKKFLFVSIFLIGYISPLNAETKKEYTKYNFYEECSDKIHCNVYIDQSHEAISL